MLVDKVGAELLRLRHGAVAANAIGSGGIVDCDQALPLSSQSRGASTERKDSNVINAPLLNGKRLVLRHAQADHLGLGIETIQVYVGDDSEWA